MTVRYRLPDELTTEATSLSATEDWVVVQKAGESVMKKAHPSVINVPDTLDADLTAIANLSHGAGKVIVSDGSNWTANNTITNGWRLLAPGATGSSPTYASQADSDTGICFFSANVVGFTTAGSARCGCGTSGNFVPLVDNSYSCGGPSPGRWSAVYAVTGTIQTSDAREKTDIADTDLGLDFVLALRPVKYRWIVGGNAVTPPEEPGADSTVTPVPGVRTHYGLLAQEVKEVLGDRDFGGWVLTPEGQQALRYDQFIAPLIAAIQALEARIAALELAP